MVEIPDSAIRAIASCPVLLDPSGPWVPEPWGVFSGMIFAAATRASYTARWNGFQPPDWNCASPLLRGLYPTPPSTKAVDEKSPPVLVAVIDKVASDVQHRKAPVQPDDQSRVRGVNSCARKPASGGKVSEAVSQQPGFRMPELVKRGKRAQSGLRRAASGDDASLTVPGAQIAEPAAGTRESASPAEGVVVCCRCAVRLRGSRVVAV